MAQLGVGQGFLAWVNLLLHNSHAVAVVNGCASRPRLFKAGVRQGCPLAPLLYLFVGQALHCFLVRRGLGLHVDGRMLLGSQFADDLKVFLEMDEEPVKALIAALDTFGDASGQHPHQDKTKLMGIGHLGEEPLPETVAGLQVVQQATALGVVFRQGTLSATTDWVHRMEKVRRVFRMIGGAKLTAFGRGIASAAYGVSKLLHLAEMLDVPATLAPELEEMAALLVERSMVTRRRRFVGVAKGVLAGHPASGGLGALPWAEHITARRAGWVVRLALATEEAEWAFVARRIMMTRRPQMVPLSVLTWGDPEAPGWDLPPPLARVVTAFRQLPRLEERPVLGPRYGPWCATAPLWGNPLLRSPDGQVMEEAFPEVYAANIRTVSQLSCAYTAVAAGWYVGAAQGALSAIHRVLTQHRSLMVAGDYFLDPLRARECLWAAFSAVPEEWRAAAIRARQDPLVAVPSEHEAMAQVAARLGWPGGTVVPLTMYTVKKGTTWLQAEGPATARRRELLSAFARLAGYTGAADPAAVVLRALRPLWQLRWENANKEVYWRLALTGLPTAARLHKTEKCGCGAEGQHGREHYFWDCMPAVAVRAALRHELGGVVVTRQQLWLVQAPAGCHQGVWGVASLAAMAAMRGAWAEARSRLMASPPTAVAGQDLGAELGRRAVAHFWERVADFCFSRRAPVGWHEGCTAAGAFMRWDPVTESWMVYRRLD
jgi:hypothetical protein